MRELKIREKFYEYLYRGGTTAIALKAAYEIIFEINFDRNKAIVYGYVRDKERTRDVMMDTVIEAGEKPRKERSKIEKVTAYLTGILKNKAMDVFGEYLHSKIQYVPPEYFAEAKRETVTPKNSERKQLPYEVYRYLEKCKMEVKLNGQEKQYLDLEEQGVNRREIAKILQEDPRRITVIRQNIYKKIKNCVRKKAGKK